MRATGQCRPKPAGPAGSGPRANIAFRSGDAIQAMPVAFRFRAGHYWIGVPRHRRGRAPAPAKWSWVAVSGSRRQQPVFVMTGERTRKPWKVMSADPAIDGH